MKRDKPDRYGRYSCGCVNTRDFKGYGVRQLCEEHFMELASQPAQQARTPEEVMAEGRS